MPQTTVLITGANRGLGLGLLKRYLQLPNHTVIAGNRDPSHATSTALKDLPTASNTRLIIVKIDAAVETDAADAITELQDQHGITHLDVVIPNAGVALGLPTVAAVKIEDVRRNIEPNVYGMLWLYQATRELLQKAEGEPVFAPMGSTAGCTENQPPFPNATYGPSKAMVNWYTVRINAEDEWLNAFVFVPGFVKTDMGLRGIERLGLTEDYPGLITVDESCDGMMKVLAGTSKAKHGGKLVAYNEEIMGW